MVPCVIARCRDWHTFVWNDSKAEVFIRDKDDSLSRVGGETLVNHESHVIIAQKESGKRMGSERNL